MRKKRYNFDYGLPSESGRYLYAERHFKVFIAIQEATSEHLTVYAWQDIYFCLKCTNIVSERVHHVLVSVLYVYSSYTPVNYVTFPTYHLRFLMIPKVLLIACSVTLEMVFTWSRSNSNGKDQVSIECLGTLLHIFKFRSCSFFGIYELREPTGMVLKISNSFLSKLACSRFVEYFIHEPTS